MWLEGVYNFEHIIADHRSLRSSLCLFLYQFAINHECWFVVTSNWQELLRYVWEFPQFYNKIYHLEKHKIIYSKTYLVLYTISHSSTRKVTWNPIYRGEAPILFTNSSGLECTGHKLQFYFALMIQQQLPFYNFLKLCALQTFKIFKTYQINRGLHIFCSPGPLLHLIRISCIHKGPGVYSYFYIIWNISKASSEIMFF